MSGRAALFVLLSATILLLCSLAAAQSQSPPQSITDVRVTSVTGCVDVYPITVNCSTTRNRLRIQTAGFPAGIDFRYLFVNAEINDNAGFAANYARPDLSDPTNSSLFVNVTARSYYPHITGTVINVSFSYYGASPSQTSPAFAAFSYRFDGPPTLTSIAGCDGSGQATLNCVPDSAVLTLTGSGLLWYSVGKTARLSIGNETSRPSFSDLTVINDTYAKLSLQRAYPELLKPQHYAGVLLPLNLTSYVYNSSGQVVYTYTTNSLHISFVSLPPPIIARKSISSCDTTVVGGMVRYSNCRPTLSRLTLFGDYLYGGQVSVGGVQCSSEYSSATLFYCDLPNFDYDPSAAYDVVAANDAGNATLSGLIRYTSAPTVASIDPCIDRGEQYLGQYFGTRGPGVRCPAGTTITLRGSRFLVTNAVSVQYLIGHMPPEATVELLAVTLLNSTTITATLPPLDNYTVAAYQTYAGSVQVVLAYNNTNTSSNALFNRLYLPLNAPSVTSVSSSSCDSVSALQLTNCRALAVITVVGSNLAVEDSMWLVTSIDSVGLSRNFLLPQAGRSNASWYDSLSNTSLVFTLAYFDADTNVQLQPDVVYTMLLWPYTSDHLSNAFRLSLTYDDVVSPPPSSSSSSGTQSNTGVTGAAASTAATTTTASATSTASHSTSTSSGLSSGAIAGIVIAAVVVAVLLALVIVWLLRYRVSDGSASWWSKSADDGWHRSMRGGVDSSSEAYTDVELQ